MSNDRSELRWGVEQRLEFIEFRLFWEGHVNRSDVMTQFGLSVNQASSDLSRYIGLAPHNMDYDRSLRTYVRQPDFRPVFDKLDARLDEGFEHPRLLCFIHPDTGVLDRHLQPVAALRQGSGGDCNPAVVGELAGVAQQVGKHLPELGGIGIHLREPTEVGHLQYVAIVAQQRGEGVANLLQDFAWLEFLAVYRHLAGFNF